MNKFYCYYT